jgi:beta-glucosidase-like glycosyl hydrolase
LAITWRFWQLPGDIRRLIETNRAKCFRYCYTVARINKKLKRLIAIELKLGKFKAAYKGQMELYLRWLEKHEKEPGEKTPPGAILCRNIYNRIKKASFPL